MVILLDTSALFALADRDDDNHGGAMRVMRDLEAAEESLLVHTYVLLETFALLHRRIGLKAAVDVSEGLRGVDTVVVDRALHDRGVARLLAHPRRRRSLVDAVSFELMAARGISTAFAYDVDFTKEGFRLA